MESTFDAMESSFDPMEIDPIDRQLTLWPYRVSLLQCSLRHDPQIKYSISKAEFNGSSQSSQT